jgi:hypothetical protein
MKTILLILLTTSILLSGCFSEKSDEELLELDRTNLEKSLGGYKALFYKFGKICVRSSSSQDTSKEFQDFQLKFRGVSDLIIQAASKRKKPMSVVDCIKLYKDYKSVQNFVLETDEDRFPTLIETFIYYNGSSESSPLFMEGKQKVFYQNIEHAMLSAMVAPLRSLGKEMSLYECYKTDTELLPDSEIKMLLQFFRGFIFGEQGFYYLSEYELTQNLAWIEQHKEVPFFLSKSLFKEMSYNEEQVHTAMHALHLLFRGIDRMMMEREIDGQRAFKDFELFLDDAHELGLENELVWAIEIFISIQNEEAEKAVAALKKLKTSDLLSEKEKNTIQESITYLESREKGKSLNAVYDKYFISKIATQYILAILSEIDWKKIMEDNDVPYVDQINESFLAFQSFSEDMEKYISVDGVKEKGQEMWSEANEWIENKKSAE